MTTSKLSVSAYALTSSSDWRDMVDESRLWQKRIFHLLSGLFGLISIVALTQLIRIECRVPEYGWTTQKVFHILNFLVNGIRSVVFAFRVRVQQFQPEVRFCGTFFLVCLLLHFSRHMHFWCSFGQKYITSGWQARGVSTDGLRPAFYMINAVLYAVQVLLWLLIWWKPTQAIIILSKIFFTGVSLFAALGFLLYGGRFFLMLQRFRWSHKGDAKSCKKLAM